MSLRVCGARPSPPRRIQPIRRFVCHLPYRRQRLFAETPAAEARNLITLESPRKASALQRLALNWSFLSNFALVRFQTDLALNRA
jgi:hypothetical protein